MKNYGKTRNATDDNIIWHMRFARWVTKATDKHTLKMYKIYCISKPKIVARECLNVTSYVRCPSDCTLNAVTEAC